MQPFQGILYYAPYTMWIIVWKIFGALKQFKGLYGEFVMEFQKDKFQEDSTR